VTRVGAASGGTTRGVAASGDMTAGRRAVLGGPAIEGEEDAVDGVNDAVACLGVAAQVEIESKY